MNSNQKVIPISDDDELGASNVRVEDNLPDLPNLAELNENMYDETDPRDDTLERAKNAMKKVKRKSLWQKLVRLYRNTNYHSVKAGARWLMESARFELSLNVSFLLSTFSNVYLNITVMEYIC